MSFAPSAAHYDRLVGRYLNTLAPAFTDAAGIAAGMRALDVGCGPGGLTAELAARLGAENVAAVDPTEVFVEACRERNPGVDVRQGVAEQLPFDDDAFDAALASLVVAFMDDAEAGVREMARVTRPGGVVAACMWDRSHGGMVALDRFWEAAASLDPGVRGERPLRGTVKGELAELLTGAGLADVQDGEISSTAHYRGFGDLWEPFTFGIGPTGAYTRTLDAEQLEQLRRECYRRVGRPDGPFSLPARAWFARGRVASA